jgi:hypothetical protein
MTNSTLVFSGKIRDNSKAVFAGIIMTIGCSIFTLLLILYSLSLKLSVDAKIIFSSVIDKYIQAKVGRIFHSAVENSVLSMAIFNSFESI